MDQSRYSRCGGFKSNEYHDFGYGGFDYGGFGNVGQYGGYRSSYIYPINTYQNTYTIAPNLVPNNYIAPTWHKPTFVFAFFLIVVLFVGLWLGRTNKNTNIYYM